MSEKFKTVQLFFKRGQWDEKKVRDAVKKSWITAAEYEMIIGREYK